MRIMIVCSTGFYDKIGLIKNYLESKGHILKMPNCYDEGNELDYEEMTDEEYKSFFKDMYYQSREAVGESDAILVANYSKFKDEKEIKNYIGASTFLEMYEAFMQGKKIYILNDYPDSMLIDEIKGFDPIILNGDLDLIK